MKRIFSYREETKAGTLFLVATPIGNLQDMTFRAVEVLRQSAVIAAEDTRQTRKLMSYFHIEGPRLISYHEYNKQRAAAEILAMLEQGLAVSLVSDAGTPGISDPGEDIVRAAVVRGYRVVPIPGACAGIAALVASGLPTGQFSFVGFLPRVSKDRKRELERWNRQRETLVFYEAPHRLRETVNDLLDVLGDRQVTVARELTKRYEEFARGTLSELAELLQTEPAKGEYVLVVAGAGEAAADGPDEVWWANLTAAAHVERLVMQGMSKKEAVKQAAKDRGVPKRDVYNQVLAQEQENH
ncbi:16S rRNA (cytidine(1402)-2'-O)-methyltransferase [Effusibacillus pohliae]|uniref:16S rRNA (cytidine(1402)-2'-O)-methyltransferase n=1 Tax=Effusibacillus pohliae TaxID=232270 RepID=UPI00036C6857|nr:16S rRNA (cytidine(1402)-2'-O)-methyltransferase [Effusibacillus pohliae]